MTRKSKAILVVIVVVLTLVTTVAVEKEREEVEQKLNRLSSYLSKTGKDIYLGNVNAYPSRDLKPSSYSVSENLMTGKITIHLSSDTELLLNEKRAKLKLVYFTQEDRDLMWLQDLKNKIEEELNLLVKTEIKVETSPRNELYSNLVKAIQTGSYYFQTNSLGPEKFLYIIKLPQDVSPRSYSGYANIMGQFGVAVWNESFNLLAHVALHEVGHLLGLPHCAETECVMSYLSRAVTLGNRCKMILENIISSKVVLKGKSVVLVSQKNFPIDVVREDFLQHFRNFLFWTCSETEITGLEAEIGDEYDTIRISHWLFGKVATFRVKVAIEQGN